MSFILKIIEGPNKGAEIALPEGVSVTVGKTDECDVVLADGTLPDEPLSIAASADGVAVDGEPQEPFKVSLRGATAFAIGPADSPWGELKWPKMETGGQEAGEARHEEEAAPSDAPHPAEEEKAAPEVPVVAEKKRHGCLGCLVALVLFLLVLAVFLWLFREEVKPYAEKASPYAGKVVSMLSRFSSSPGPSAGFNAQPTETLADVVARLGVSESERDGKKVVVGDFGTRAERLAAAAELYAAKPGIELDFADAESLKTAVADTLALVGERDLSVVSVTNRVAVLSGGVRNIRRMLEAISVDVPKIANVDMTGAFVSQASASAEQEPGETEGGLPVAFRVSRQAKKKDARPSFPVCGIMTAPYPCLVLRDGRRILEGAPVGDSVVLKIEADSVTLTNATGRFVWNP